MQVLNAQRVIALVSDYLRALKRTTGFTHDYIFPTR